MKLADADMPRPWRRAGKLTARSLLRAELEALRLLRTALRAGTDAALAALAVLPLGDNRRVAVERALEALRGHRDDLQRKLQMAIGQGRLGGKRAALARFEAEWTQVRAEVQTAQLADPGPVLVHAQLTGNDNASTDAAAASLSVSWLAGATAAAWTWAEDDGQATLAAAVAASSQALDGRVRRTAATETARAFADGRDEGMGWVVEKHGEAQWFPAVLKIWNAVNDRRVCPRCAALDGKITLLGLPFPGRLEPGYVHPHCRCVPGIVFLPARITVEAEQGLQVDGERSREAA